MQEKCANVFQCFIIGLADDHVTASPSTFDAATFVCVLIGSLFIVETALLSPIGRGVSAVKLKDNKSE